MIESLDKWLLAGLGALSMTREKAEKLFQEYVKRGQAAKGSRSGFIKDVLNASEKTKADLERVIADQVKAALAKLDVATKADLERLEAKIDRLKGKGK